LEIKLQESAEISTNINAIKNTFVFQPSFPDWIALRIGFWSLGSAPVFSSLSKSTNNFSISRSFSSSDMSGNDGFSCSAIPVIGLIGVPSAVVVGALDDPSADGAAKIPLWKRNPATLPYPTNAQRVVAESKKRKFKKMGGGIRLQTNRLNQL